MGQMKFENYNLVILQVEKKNKFIFVRGIVLLIFLFIFVKVLNNNCPMENMNVVSEKRGVLNDTVGLNVSNLRTWLEDFKRSHYKNRPLTDHFWNVVYFSQKLGVNVEGVLGKEIWNHLKEMKPHPFMVNLHPVFHDKDPKMNNYKPFLVELL